jgi:hypothetical protein
LRLLGGVVDRGRLRGLGVMHQPVEQVDALIGARS